IGECDPGLECSGARTGKGSVGVHRSPGGVTGRAQRTGEAGTQDLGIEVGVWTGSHRDGPSLLLASPSVPRAQQEGCHGNGQKEVPGGWEGPGAGHSAPLSHRSIHNGVIAVFQRKGLPDQELFTLNEGVRQLLKTELGSFFTEYLQNQLLTKGMVILRDKIRFYEGQKLLDSLAETWDFFFSDVLPTLQAIFYPVQGKEPSVRQLALLHFRNTITLS
ncbi:PREDICTED: proline-rich protein 5, partial [Myotis brandtii]|uniref:proline-rich protein 5 n=1 Tax=Myotis brandtii TaxID=109478 RepID=UPI0007047AE4